MSCRRAFGALLTVFILSPLPAFCMVCAKGECPQAAESASTHGAMAGSGPMGDSMGDHCQTAPGPSVTAVAAPDCCGNEPDTAATPGVPAPASAGLALAPLAQDAVLSPPPACSSGVRRNDAPPPETPTPLYTLHSSLLI